MYTVYKDKRLALLLLMTLNFKFCVMLRERGGIDVSEDLHRPCGKLQMRRRARRTSGGHVRSLRNAFLGFRATSLLRSRLRHENEKIGQWP